MSQLQKTPSHITVEEYLADEEHSEVRHEYIGGEVYAMSGGTRNHNRIAGNIFSFLDQHTDGGPCKPFINDVKLKVQSIESESYYYPDILVTCDPEDNNELFVEKPTTIIEVLSDSTEKLDKAGKFFAYRTLDSLEEYVLISQKTKEVTIASKANGWKTTVLKGDKFSLQLTCTEESIPSSRIYRNVEFTE